MRALELIAEHARTFRIAGCAAVDKLSRRGEVAYYDAAAALDGSLNALAEIDGRPSRVPVTGAKPRPKKTVRLEQLSLDEDG